MDSVITEVPGGTIVDHLLTGNQGIDFLNITLEISEVLECFILGNDRIRILVQPVGTRSEGNCAYQKEQQTTRKGFDIIIVFHNR
jgi:hypothetical protein